MHRQYIRIVRKYGNLFVQACKKRVEKRAYCVHHTMSKNPKQLPNCLKDQKRRRPHRLVSSVKSLIILLLFLTIVQHESLMYQENILVSDRILYNLTAQIEPVQEK